MEEKNNAVLFSGHKSSIVIDHFNLQTHPCLLALNCQFDIKYLSILIVKVQIKQIELDDMETITKFINLNYLTTHIANHHNFEIQQFV